MPGGSDKKHDHGALLLLSNKALNESKLLVTYLDQPIKSESDFQHAKNVKSLESTY